MAAGAVVVDQGAGGEQPGQVGVQVGEVLAAQLRAQLPVAGLVLGLNGVGHGFYLFLA